MVPDHPSKVLLIEDNAGDARLLREYLLADPAAGFRLEWAATLAAGLEHLSQPAFDLIVLDLTLPDSKGLETFRRVHESAPGIAVLVLSGVADEALAVEAVRQGAQDYIVKGQVSGSRLARAVRYAIERHHRAANGPDF